MLEPQERLISGLKAGRLEAYRELYDRHGDAVLRLAVRILGDMHAAEDATQETFLRVYRGIGGYHERASLTTWLYRITVNTCLKMRRRVRPMELNMEQMEQATSVADVSLDAPEALLALDHAIEDLPLQQRLVFTLVAVEGHMPCEVAEILELAPGTVRHHLFRARESLGRRLKPYLEPSHTRVKEPRP